MTLPFRRVLGHVPVAHFHFGPTHTVPRSLALKILVHQNGHHNSERLVRSQQKHHFDEPDQVRTNGESTGGVPEDPDTDPECDRKPPPHNYL